MNSPLPIAELRQQLANQPPDHPPAARTAVLCELARACARAGLPHDGLAAVKEAIKLAQSHQLVRERAEAMDAASMCHYFRGDYLMAIASGLDAYQGFAGNDQYVPMGHTLATVAAACKEIRASDLAIEALNGCLEIAGRAGDVFLEARSRNMLGMVFTEMQRFDDAEAEFNHSRGCLAGMGETSHLPKVLANQAEILKRRADTAAAVNQPDRAAGLLLQATCVLDEAVAVARSDGNDYEVADKTTMLAEYHRLLGDHDVAARLVGEALEMATRLKHPQIIIEGHLGQGKILLDQRDHHAAAARLKRALELARDAELRDLQLQAHRQLAECYGAIAHDRDAAAHAMLADELDAAAAEANHEAQREVRLLWERYFSHHPLIGSAD